MLSQICESIQRITRNHEHTDTWRPQLFRLAHSADARALHDLLECGRIRTVHDVIEDQLKELVRVRHPEIDDVTLERGVDDLVAGVSIHAYGVWVYYPWSGRLVHVLPPGLFQELRTARNKNKITGDEQLRLAQLRIGIVGLSVGQTSALTLAMEGVGGMLRLADFDTLSLSNLNRLRAGVHEMGDSKARITARAISELNPFLEIELWDDGVTADNLDAFVGDPDPLDLVVEECDDLQIKILVRERARALGIPVVMETSDRGMLDIERYDLEPTRPILHGLIGDLKSDDLSRLTASEKIPTVLRILGPQTLSPRMAASLIDVGTGLGSWPQLGSGVTLGGALVTDSVRRIALGRLNCSGRFYVDLDRLISDSTPSQPPRVAPFELESRIETASELPPLRPATCDRLDDDQIRALVGYATLAPSGGNCQPWRFVFTEGALRCFHDVERSLSLLDFNHWASYLALGAAAENLELAARSMGLDAHFEQRPTGALSSEVYRVRFTRADTPQIDPRVESIAQRVTNRRLSQRRPLSPEATRALLDAVSPGRAQLKLETRDGALDSLATIIAQADRLRMMSQTLHREMMDEIRWSAEEVHQTRDGLDLATLELTPTDRAGLALTSSWTVIEAAAHVGGGIGLETPARRSIASASAVGLLSTVIDSTAGLVEAGRVLQRIWLQATSQGLAFQPMTALTFLAARVEHGGGEGLGATQIQQIRHLMLNLARIFEVGRDDTPLVLFRVGHAGRPTARSLRRRVGDVLQIVR